MIRWLNSPLSIGTPPCRIAGEVGVVRRLGISASSVEGTGTPANESAANIRATLGYESVICDDTKQVKTKMSAIKTMLYAVALLGLLAVQAQATPYSMAVLADGPVGYWQFENAPKAGGTAIDTAGGDHNGTYSSPQAMTQIAGVPLPGIGGNAMLSPGEPSHINVGPDAAFAGTDFTHEAWIKYSPTPDRRYGSSGTWIARGPFLPKGVGGPQSGQVNQMDGEYEDGPAISAGVNGNSTNAVPHQEHTFPSADEWHHIVTTFDDLDGSNTQITFYVDGGQVLQTTVADVAVDDSGFGLTIGLIHIYSDRATPSTGFAGGYDEFAYYDKVLTSQQVANHYRAARSIKGITDMLSYVVKPISSIPILPDTDPVPGELSTELSITAARGEYEPGSFVLRAMKDVRQLSVVPSELKGEAGNLIPSSCVDIKVVKCWYQRGNAWNSLLILKPWRDLVPELLLNDDTLVKVDYETKENYLKLRFPEGDKYVWISHVDSAGLDWQSFEEYSKRHDLPAEKFPVKDSPTLLPVDIAKGTNKQFWITLKVPEEASPGIYAGKLTLKIGAETVGAIDLKLRVLPFDLSAPKTHYDLTKEFECSIYYRGTLGEKAVITSEAKSEQQVREELENLYNHGVNPTIYQTPGEGFKDLEKVLKMREEVGLGRQPLYYLGVGTGGHSSTIKDVLEFVQPYGIPEVYFYGLDEATGERLTAQRPAWKAVRDAGGKTFVAGFGGTYEAMGDLLDIFVSSGRPHLPEAEKWHSIGHRIWNYGNPQGGLENPEPYRRNFGLLLWKANYDGACTFAYHYAMGNLWNDFDIPDWSGLNFTYPTVDGVIDTIAWEGYREAFDDIKYATTLMFEIEKAKKEGDAEKKKIAMEAEKYLEELDVGGGDLDRNRSEMIRYILKLGRSVESLGEN